MTPHETGSTATPADARAAAPLTRTFGPQGPTLGDLSDAYLQDYQVRQFRSQSTARGRTAHLAAFFGRAARAATLTTYQIRQYQLTRRAAGAATGTINRETSALHRMCTLAVHWGWLDTVPGFPDRLRENPPRQGFFEHPEYLAVRVRLPAPWQDILDLAYYSGWRKQEILGLTWEEIDMAGGVIRLSPARSKTLVGRILPISQPIAEALARRRARRDPDSPLVFHRDGIPVRRWRTAWRTACQAAGVPTRFLHDCRRTAARNLIRANVPERVAMLLTGHKSRAIFDRYNIIHEQELLDAGDQLVEYLAQQAQAVPARRRPALLRGSKTDPQRPLPTDPLTIDSIRRRPTKLSHLIEDVTCEDGLRLLPRPTARSKALPDDQLVPEEGVLHTGLLMVARVLLPLSPSSLLHLSDRAVARGRSWSPSRHGGCPGRWNDDRRATRTRSLVDATRVVGRVRREAGDVAFDLVDQIEGRRRVVNMPAGQGVSDDHARSVDAQMKLLPAAYTASAMFHGRPFTFTHSREPGTVDDEMYACARGEAAKCKVEVLTTP